MYQVVTWQFLTNWISLFQQSVIMQFKKFVYESGSSAWFDAMNVCTIETNKEFQISNFNCLKSRIKMQLVPANRVSRNLIPGQRRSNQGGGDPCDHAGEAHTTWKLAPDQRWSCKTFFEDFIIFMQWAIPCLFLFYFIFLTVNCFNHS